MLNLLRKKRKQIKPPQSQNCSSAVARHKKYKSPDLPKVSCSQRFHYLWSFPVACLHIDFPLPKATFGVWMPQLWYSYAPSICEWTKSSALPCFLRRILFLTSLWPCFGPAQVSACTLVLQYSQQLHKNAELHRNAVKSLVRHCLLEYNCACKVPRAVLLAMAFEASDKKELCYFALMLCAVAIHFC